MSPDQISNAVQKEFTVILRSSVHRSVLNQSGLITLTGDRCQSYTFIHIQFKVNELMLQKDCWWNRYHSSVLYVTWCHLEQDIQRSVEKRSNRLFKTDVMICRHFILHSHTHNCLFSLCKKLLTRESRFARLELRSRFSGTIFVNTFWYFVTFW